ncbi:class I SAM-dependent methyltransferase [Mycolicibacterium sp. CBM1]
MPNVDTFEPDISTMPRGGPNASWLDRLLQTDTLEYLDRDDVADELKQKVITGLDAIGTRTGQHEQHARLALEVVGDIEAPRILELGAGHGKLSASILELHPQATVTASDLDATSVANMAAGPLGQNPRARTQVVDATAIDAADNSYDLVVFALAFHHLPPVTAYRAIAEATRVATKFLVVDLKRSSPVGMLFTPLVMAPVSLALIPPSSIIPVMHDGFISMLRAYSPEALRALGKAADPDMNVEFREQSSRLGGAPMTAVFSRPTSDKTAEHTR